MDRKEESLQEVTRGGLTISKDGKFMNKVENSFSCNKSFLGHKDSL